MNDLDRKEPVFGAPPPSEGPAIAECLEYDGEAGELAQIAVVNILLTLVTLGIYRFWAKTRVRRYLWGHVSFQGDRLEYTGRGLELFLGLLIASLILAPLIAATVAVQLVFAGNPAVLAINSLLQLPVILFLIQIAIYRARRYRLSRTQWRGIRIGQTGSSFKYALVAFGWMIVVAVTLGLAYPVLKTRMQHFRTSNTWFGDRNLTFDGRAGDLFVNWIIALLLWVPSLGWSFIWYRIREFRYFTSKTRLGGLRFESDLSAASVFFVMLGYVFVVILVVGLAFGGLSILGVLDSYQASVTQGAGTVPDLGNAFDLAVLPVILVVAVILSVLQLVMLIHPLARLLCESIEVTGTEDFDAIAQSQQEAPGRGEGLADALDVGAI